MSNAYDVVVVGGGMVGAAFAAALQRWPSSRKLRIAVLEARRPQPFDAHAVANLRVSAVSSASQRLLTAVGAWPGIAACRVCAYRTMYVWEGASDRPDAAIAFDSADVGASELGHIVENDLIRWSLLESLRLAPGVDLIAPVRLTALEFSRSALRLWLDDGRELSARLVVGADGAGSPSRTMAGLETTGWSYEQRAVVATVETQRPHRHTAWQRFLPAGPLALLPLHDGRSSIVWSTAPAHAEELLGLDGEEFARAVAEASDRMLGEVSAVSEARAAFPLQLQHSRRYVRARFALIGDSAHAVHPLAGQGANLGIADAAALAEAVADHVAAGGDPGDLRALRRYERWRKGENLATMAVLDLFKRTFGSAVAPVRLLRRAGVQLTDATPPLKRRLIRRAMGLSGELPSLLRVVP